MRRHERDIDAMCRRPHERLKARARKDMPACPALIGMPVEVVSRRERSKDFLRHAAGAVCPVAQPASQPSRALREGVRSRRCLPRSVPIPR